MCDETNCEYSPYYHALLVQKPQPLPQIPMTERPAQVRTSTHIWTLSVGRLLVYLHYSNIIYRCSSVTRESAEVSHRVVTDPKYAVSEPTTL